MLNNTGSVHDAEKWNNQNILLLDKIFADEFQIARCHQRYNNHFYVHFLKPFLYTHKKPLTPLHPIQNFGIRIFSFS